MNDQKRSQLPTQRKKPFKLHVKVAEFILHFIPPPPAFLWTLRSSLRLYWMDTMHHETCHFSRTAVVGKLPQMKTGTQLR